MLSNFHLPLNPIDRVNQPPVSYLQVQDGLILCSGLCWTTAYILYIRQAYRDKSYGMPLVCLCANIAWEFVFGAAIPESAAQVVSFFPWFVIDIGIVYTTWKFGREQWKHAPVVAQNLGWILIGGITGMLVLFWTFLKTYDNRYEAGFYLAWTDQIIVSTTSVAQLMSRNNTSGHSWGIWFTRWIGSVFAELIFVWRYWNYPESYPVAATHVTIFLFVVTELADLTYPFVYASLEKQEKKKLK
ncbi:hypothetical protein F4806DRAFT_52672 [Annulohypoxylon nitens]|nr:hypothetical protein F4806DRAFT_52672 [Annulohypoxylon nitens]